MANFNIINEVTIIIFHNFLHLKLFYDKILLVFELYFVLISFRVPNIILTPNFNTTQLNMTINKIETHMK